MDPRGRDAVAAGFGAACAVEGQPTGTADSDSAAAAVAAASEEQQTSAAARVGSVAVGPLMISPPPVTRQPAQIWTEDGPLD